MQKVAYGVNLPPKPCIYRTSDVVSTCKPNSMFDTNVYLNWKHNISPLGKTNIPVYFLKQINENSATKERTEERVQWPLNSIDAQS